MKLPVESAKSNFQVSNLQPYGVIIADLVNCIGSPVTCAITTAIMGVGLFSKMSRIKSHKKRSVDFHDTLKANNTMLNELQKHLDQGIEKWGNINNDTDLINTFNTTMRP